jgi:uncharacterized membrane protein YkvA (DUF1232 family)
LRLTPAEPTFDDVKSLKTAAYLAGVALSVLYILNPTAGTFELLPDNLPGIGNIDEAAMTALLISCIRALRRQRLEAGEDASATAS